MATAVVTCALRLSNDLMALGRYKAAEEAASAGLLAAPDDDHLRRDRRPGRRRPQRGADSSGPLHRRRSPDPDDPEDPADPRSPTQPTLTRGAHCSSESK